jgi:hypothetical protein
MPTETLPWNANSPLEPSLDFVGDYTFRPESGVRPSASTAVRTDLPGAQGSAWSTDWMGEAVQVPGGSLKSQRLAKFPTRLRGSLDADWAAEWMKGEGSCCGSCAVGGGCEGGGGCSCGEIGCGCGRSGGRDWKRVQKGSCCESCTQGPPCDMQSTASYSTSPGSTWGLDAGTFYAGDPSTPSPARHLDAWASSFQPLFTPGYADSKIDNGSTKEAIPADSVVGDAQLWDWQEWPPADAASCTIGVYCHPTGPKLFKLQHCFIQVKSCQDILSTYELGPGANGKRLGGNTAMESLILKDSYDPKKYPKGTKLAGECRMTCQADAEGVLIDPCSCIEWEAKNYPFREKKEYGLPSATATPKHAGPNSNTFASYISGKCSCLVTFPRGAVGHDFLDGGPGFEPWRKKGRGKKYRRSGGTWWKPGTPVPV